MVDWCVGWWSLANGCAHGLVAKLRGGRWLRRQVRLVAQYGRKNTAVTHFPTNIAAKLGHIQREKTPRSTEKRRKYQDRLQTIGTTIHEFSMAEQLMDVPTNDEEMVDTMEICFMNRSKDGVRPMAADAEADLCWGA